VSARGGAPAEPAVAVLGLGYVGLPLAAAFARAGVRTLGFDVSAERVARLLAAAAGAAPPPDVPARSEAGGPLEVIASGALRLSHDSFELKRCDVFLIAVPTPVDAAHRPDPGSVLAAADLIGAALAGRPEVRGLVVVESTVAPGTTRDLVGPRVGHAAGLVPEVDFDLACSPERINPGDPLHGLLDVPKVVAADTDAALARVVALYARLLRDPNGATAGAVAEDAPLLPPGSTREPSRRRSPPLETSRSTAAAELAKLLENAQRDVNIALVNQVARLSEALALPPGEALRLARTKWNFAPYAPGFVGGHCVSVDPWYLVQSMSNAGLDASLLSSARAANDAMPAFVARCTLARVGQRPALSPPRIGVFGVTYKEDVADVRNSGARSLAAALTELGAEVVFVDPLAEPSAVARELGLTLSPQRLVTDLDALILAAPHRVWRTAPASLVACLRVGGLLVDVRGALDAARLAGVAYWRP
jgi:UDP-N-acetyl-D-galactosamine dehydrogenase